MSAPLREGARVYHDGRGITGTVLGIAPADDHVRVLWDNGDMEFVPVADLNDSRDDGTPA